MGYYIEVPEHFNKAQQLIDLYGAKLVNGYMWDDIPDGFVAICVVENPLFDAAAIAYDKDEFDDFTDPEDPRPRKLVILPIEKVIELNPQVKDKLT